jgi:prevent-host-death family protein
MEDSITIRKVTRDLGKLSDLSTDPITKLPAESCSILDEVARTGEPVTILKRGRPVAQLVSSVPREEGYPREMGPSRSWGTSSNRRFPRRF